MATRGKIRAERVARVVLTMLAIALIGIILVGLILLYRAAGGLFVNRGGEVISVPVVTSLTVAQALAALSAEGLTGKVVHQQYDDQVKKGLICKQLPAGGAKRRPGARVELWESLGPAQFTVPQLTGLPVGEVPGKLAAAGLSLGSVRKVFRRDVPRGQVVNQDPEAGREFQSPVAVDLIVADSADPPQVVMPALMGLSLSQAEAQLAQANLQLAVVNYQSRDDAPSGVVLGQSVGSNSEVAIGTRVELDVALPSALLAQPSKSITVSVPVPPGPTRQPVKIKVFDDLATGGQVVYEGEHAPGDTVEKRVNVEGPARILIFVGDMTKPFREERL